MSITSLKLISGEEIIASFVKTTDTFFVVTKPRLVALQQIGPNQVGVGLIPWMPSAGESDIGIVIKHIMITVSENDIPKHLVDSYLQQTSKIQLASSGDVSSILGAD